ncbi:MAG: PIG-L deacetylase family protein [Planctomycetota bacterium]
MNTISFKDVDTVLCLGAHADDIEIGCGGTLMKIIESNPNIKIHWVVFSASGQRETEAVQSAHGLVGNAKLNVETHRFTDSYFPSQWKRIKKEFSRIRREIKPQIVFTHRLEDRHQDHRVIAEFTWNAFRDQAIFEYEIPKYEGDLGQPNVFVPLSQTVSEEKCRWITEVFQTQKDKYWFDKEVLMSLLRIRGVEAGRTVKYAEGFYCRKLAFDF